MKMQSQTIDRKRIRPMAPPVMFQTWNDLLFLHWRVDEKLLRTRLPAGLEPDLFEGDAWVGIVPFRMCDVRPAGLPCVAGLSNFLELNVRTYVTGPDGVAGVWFFSLDCNCPPAVWIARTLFHLNYQHSKMKAHCGLASLESSAQRNQKCAGAFYKWDRPVRTSSAKNGSLEEFLVERYVLYSCTSNGELRMGRVYHPPYEIAPVRVSHADRIPFEWNELPDPGRAPDHILASPGVKVEIFPLKRAFSPTGPD